MSSDEQCDVLVIGGGPVGLTLASELARHGAAPVVIDKVPAIREVSKALILHVRTQQALDKVGIMPAVRAEAVPLREVVVHGYGKHLGGWDLDGVEGPYPHPLIIGQNRTQHLLADRLAALGVAVRWNTEATAVDLSDSEASVRVGPAESAGGAGAGGASAGATRTIRCKYVVGCEGSSSLVRRAIGASFEGERYAGEQFVQADCNIRWMLPSGRSYLFLTPAGYLMVIEMPGGRVRVFISIPDALPSVDAKALGAVEDQSHEPTLDEIRGHLVRLTGFEAELSDPVWLARYRTSHRYADRFSRGRAFIAGDAAHVHVPIGGQGMNTGIQDAFNLGWKLAGVVRGSYPETILESYHRERHPVAASLIRGTDFAYRGLLHPSELKQRAARLFGPFVMKLGPVQDFMRSTLEELRVEYPDSPLNGDAAEGSAAGVSGGGAAGPGRHMPDAPVVRASDARTTSLTELTRNERWTLVLFAGLDAKVGVEPFVSLAERLLARWRAHLNVFVVAADPAAAHGQPSDALLIDGYAALHTCFGVTEPTAFVIRPDGYVARRISNPELPQLESFFGEMILT